MYILVEKDLATKKKKKKTPGKTYGLVNIHLLYLNESTSLFFVDYPTEKRMLEWLTCAAELSTVQTDERAKI